ncbi:MAG: hypothetical protein HY905_16740 [Deltaproteobacteria bacterium]|nr:hypothetical protein [Deltaproteobacteria bacterium]
MKAIPGLAVVLALASAGCIRDSWTYRPYPDGSDDLVEDTLVEMDTGAPEDPATPLVDAGDEGDAAVPDGSRDVVPWDGGPSRIGEASRAWAFMAGCRGDYGENLGGSRGLSATVDFLIKIRARSGTMVNEANGQAAIGPTAEEVMACARLARTCADFEACEWHGHAPTACTTTAITCDHGWARQCDTVGGRRFRVWDCSRLVPDQPDPDLRCMDGLGCVMPTTASCTTPATTNVTRCVANVVYSCRQGGREAAQPCPSGWVCGTVTFPTLDSFPSCIPNEPMCTSPTEPRGVCVGSLLNECGLGDARHMDCAMFGLPCTVLTLIAQCSLPPAMSECPDNMDRCEGNVVNACQGGRRLAFDCASIEGGTCAVGTGSHAWCHFPGSL